MITIKYVGGTIITAKTGKLNGVDGPSTLPPGQPAAIFDLSGPLGRIFVPTGDPDAEAKLRNLLSDRRFSAHQIELRDGVITTGLSNAAKTPPSVEFPSISQDPSAGPTRAERRLRLILGKDL